MFQWLKMVTEISDNANLLLLDCLVINSKFGAWRRGIRGLANGQIPEELITVTDMVKALHDIENELEQHYPRFRLIHGPNDVQYYYLNDVSTAFVKYEHGDLSIIVHISLPISTLDVFFNVYAVEVRPVPIMSTNSSVHKGYTILDRSVIADYFVITEDSQFYTDMDGTQYTYCINLRDTTCPILTAIYDKRKYLCSGALFLNDVTAIVKYCKFDM